MYQELVNTKSDCIKSENEPKVSTEQQIWEFSETNFLLNQFYFRYQKFLDVFYGLEIRSKSRYSPQNLDTFHKILIYSKKS